MKRSSYPLSALLDANSSSNCHKQVGLGLLVCLSATHRRSEKHDSEQDDDDEY